MAVNQLPESLDNDNHLAMEKRIGIIGSTNGKIPRVEILKILTKKNYEPTILKCKRCGTTSNILLNGYCIECDEELEQQAK